MREYISNTKPDFNFFIPIDPSDIVKAGNGKDKYQDMIVSGIASDESTDSDEEILQPSGFELDRFLKLGWVNYDHRSKDDPKYLIGEPLEAKVVGSKFFVKAKLFGESEVARNLYDAMVMLKKSGSKRKIGWSIEGKATERDETNPKIVKKALITGIALTPNPKNVNSYADIVKGKYSTPIMKSESDKKDSDYIVDMTKNGVRFIINRDLKLKIEKAMDSVSAKPLIKESLEGKKKKAILNVACAFQKGLIRKSDYYNIISKINI
jgi:hypothetical protein